jgi:hypothetical protein
MMRNKEALFDVCRQLMEDDPGLVAWSERCTRDFRTSSASRWQALRERVADEGLEPEAVAIAGFGPDGGGLGAGIAVTEDGRVFAFTLALGSTAAGHDTGSLDDG